MELDRKVAERNRVPDPIGVERRIWVVPYQDKATYLAAGWHKLTAGLNSMQPFGACDATVRPKSDAYSLPEVVRTLLKRNLITPDGSAYYNNQITFFEIAGHSPKTLQLIPADHINPNSATYNTPEAQATRAAIQTLARNMTPDCEIRFNSCWCGLSPDYMMLLSQAFGGRTVTANTGTVFMTGAGQWLTTAQNGTVVKPDERWGSFPWPARLYVWAAKLPS
jgi:hypothetical protein